MVAWFSCGDTSLVTWADSQDARKETADLITAVVVCAEYE